MTDCLTLTRAFEGAGIQSELAERLTTEIYDAIHESVATKPDLAELEQNINATKARDIYQIRSAMTAELAALEKKVTVVGYRLITGLATLMVVIVALLFAALHYWPPHG